MAKKMQAAAVIGRIEIKNPFAFIKNERIKSTYLWFKIDKNTVGLWEDCELMTPRWSLTVYTREEAIEEIKDIITNRTCSTDWKLLSTTAPELKSFVKIDKRKKIGLL